MVITWWSKLGGGSWKRFKKVARLLPESSLLISKRMEVMVTTWSHGHPNLFNLDHIICFTFYNQLLGHCNQILHMFQDHYRYFSETSTLYIASYPERTVKAKKKLKKGFSPHDHLIIFNIAISSFSPLSHLRDRLQTKSSSWNNFTAGPSLAVSYSH